MLNLSDISTLVTIVIGILTVLGTIFGWFGKLWRWLTGLFKAGAAPGNIIVPKKSLVIHPPTHERGFHWSFGTSGGKPAMQVSGEFFATNISIYKVAIAGVRMRKPKAMGYAFAQKVDENIYGGYAIPEGEMTHVTFGFWLIPPFKKAGESFRTDVAVVDQFGNDHWLKDIEFKFE